MELWHSFVFVGLATVFASSQTCFGGILSCPDDGKPADQMCDEKCEVADNTTKSENVFGRILDSYIEHSQVVFVDNACGKFQWEFSNAVLEARHIMLTIYATYVDDTLYEDEVYDRLCDDSEKKRFRPVPGCCGVPLHTNSCKTSISLTKHHQLFFSLSLFRIRSYSELGPTHCWIPPMKKNPEEATPERTGIIVSINRIQTIPAPPAFKPPPPRPPTVFEKYVGRIEAPKYASVCMFDMPKDEVMGNNSDTSPYNIDSELFNRGVFHMSGYYYKNERVYHHSQPNETVQCSTQTFGDSPNNTVYNMTSSNPDNNTFTCMILWTSLNESDQVTVKCMPHNETYLYISADVHETFVQNLTIIVVVSTVGTILLVVTVIAVLWRWKRKLQKALKDSRKVPKHLDDVMNNDSGWFEEKSGASMYDAENVDTLQIREYQNFSYIGDDQTKSDHQSNYRNEEVSVHGTSFSVNSDYIQKQSDPDTQFSSSSSDFVQSQKRTSVDNKTSDPVFHDSGLGSGESIPPSARMLSAVNTLAFSISSKPTSESDKTSQSIEKCDTTSPNFSENSYDSGVGSGGSFNYSSSGEKPEHVTPAITLTGPTKLPKDATHSRKPENTSKTLHAELTKHEDGDRNVCILDRRSPIFLYSAKKDDDSRLPSGNEQHQPTSPPLTAVSCTDSGYPESPLTCNGDSSESDEDMTYARKHDLICDVTNVYLSKEELAQRCDGEHLNNESSTGTDTKHPLNCDVANVVGEDEAPYIDKSELTTSPTAQKSDKVYSTTLPEIDNTDEGTNMNAAKLKGERTELSKLRGYDNTQNDQVTLQTYNCSYANHTDKPLSINNLENVTNLHDSPYLDKTELGEKCGYDMKSDKKGSSKTQHNLEIANLQKHSDITDEESGYFDKTDYGKRLGYDVAHDCKKSSTEAKPRTDLDNKECHVEKTEDDSPYLDKTELGERLGYGKSSDQTQSEKDTQNNINDENINSQQKNFNHAADHSDSTNNECDVDPYLDKRTRLPITACPTNVTPYLDKQTLQPIENVCRIQQGEGSFVNREIA